MSKVLVETQEPRVGDLVLYEDQSSFQHACIYRDKNIAFSPNIVLDNELIKWDKE